MCKARQEYLAQGTTATLAGTYAPKPCGSIRKSALSLGRCEPAQPNRRLLTPMQSGILSLAGESFMELIYQSQNSQQTLREAIEEYHRYLTRIGRKILTDSPGADNPVWLYHDATHAIFGHDTTIEGEATLDFWVFFGSDFSWKVLWEYQQIPEIKELSRAVVGQLGISFIPKLYWRNRKALWQVIRNTRKMHKKWPFEPPTEFLDRTLADLRQEFGITLLTPKQRTPSQITDFDYSIVSA